MIGILSSLLPVATKIIDRVVPDKNAAKKAKLDMQKELTTAFNKANLKSSTSAGTVENFGPKRFSPAPIAQSRAPEAVKSSVVLNFERSK